MELKEYLKTLAKKRVASGALIFNQKNKILFVEPSYKSNWEIPGGAVEENESPEQAVQKEVFEELNLGIESLSLLHIEYQLQELDDVFHFIYEAKINENNIKLDYKELKFYRYRELHEMKDLLLP